MRPFSASSFPLFNSFPDAMVAVDGEGRIRLVNEQAERLFGYGRDEMLGQPIEMLVPQKVRARHAGHRSAYVRDPKTRPMGIGLELAGVRKDGRHVPVEISLSPLETDEGTFVVSAIRDITERKEFERTLQAKNTELQAANAAKDQFLASMSHELRTPLNAIIGFTGTLLMRLPGPLTEEQEQQLRIVQSSGRHLLSLISDILDLAKIEAGKVELHLEPMSLHDVIEEVRDSLRSMAASKGLEFDVVLPRERTVVRSDRRALSQILINLANNALKYTEKGSVTIDVSTRATSSGLHCDVNVRDTGIGIKPQDRERLFQAFEQLEPLSRRSAEGAGLGLHLSQKLSKLIGAHLSFISEPGEGSVFTLTLPVDAKA
ncbi:MAG TPA: ATP-binding protein [Candidatus Dormibacteraeota bacterium]|nr:ATP-binding protein [Candidatus Dormibacteraeota bacterium]